MNHNKLLCFWILFLFFSICVYAQSGNTKPTANAGVDKNVKLGEEVELQGSGSDAENDPLTFTWAIVFKPVGSKAELSDNNVPNPIFIVDVEGNYMFNLRVNDGLLNSLPDTVTYTTQITLLGNNKPTANAGIDRNVKVGEEVELQGSGSDSDNDTITFNWLMLSKPENSRAVLSSDNIQNPKLLIDTAGFYAIQLITNDGKENSEADTVIINAMGSLERCREGTCNLNTKQWCNNGVFVSEGYCEHCKSQDNDCLSTLGGFCTDDSDCKAGLECISRVCSETKPIGEIIPTEEKDIDEDITPLEPVSEPGGIGRILFIAVILIILFGAGSYAVYYYKDYLIKPKRKKLTVLSPISRYIPVLKTPEEKKKIKQIVKKRRKAKKEKREKFFEVFYKK